MDDLTNKQVTQLALLMKFLHSLGFDLATVKRAADCWWQSVDGVPVVDAAQSKWGKDGLCKGCGYEYQCRKNSRCERSFEPLPAAGVNGMETVYFRRGPNEAEDSLTVPAGTAKQHVREELITRIVGVPVSQAQSLSPGQQQAMERQKRLVATLPQTREQAAMLTPCLATGQSADPTPRLCGHCGKVAAPGGTCAYGVVGTPEAEPKGGV